MELYIPKIGYPWTVYLHDWNGVPGPGWKRYAYTAKCAGDAESDISVMWQTASLGKIWLDDLLVDESEQEINTTTPAPKLPAENPLNRSLLRNPALPPSRIRRVSQYHYNNGYHPLFITRLPRSPKSSNPNGTNSDQKRPGKARKQNPDH